MVGTVVDKHIIFNTVKCKFTLTYAVSTEAVVPMTPVLAEPRHPLAGGGMSSPSSGTPALKSNQKYASVVLALGGGAVMTEGSEKMVHEGTLCVYLKASVDTLVEHLSGETSGRPLLNNQSVMSSESSSVMSSEVETSPLRKRILELMSLRAETYQRTAHLLIETDGKSIDEIANEIVANLLP